MEGPATDLTFLSTLFVTVHGVLKLPPDNLLMLFVYGSGCKKRELLSLIDHLSHGQMVHADLVTGVVAPFLQQAHGFSTAGLPMGSDLYYSQLVPSVAACAVWEHLWKGRTICCLSDNATVVAIIKSGSSMEQIAMPLVQCLFFTAVHQLVLVPRICRVRIMQLPLLLWVP